jgi:hypothetical protein
VCTSVKKIPTEGTVTLQDHLAVAQYRNVKLTAAIGVEDSHTEILVDKLNSGHNRNEGNF